MNTKVVINKNGHVYNFIVEFTNITIAHMFSCFLRSTNIKNSNSGKIVNFSTSKQSIGTDYIKQFKISNPMLHLQIKNDCDNC